MKKFKDELEKSGFLNEMLSGYLEAALWSTSGYDECEFLDEKFSISDISDEFTDKAFSDCEKFIDRALDLFFHDEIEAGTIGHNFWLNRNHHGAGFWDGDYINGDDLSDICHSFGECDDELREAVYSNTENESEEK